MPRRPAPGRSPAQEADAAFDDEGRPSKSQRKRDSHALQTLGDEVAALPASRLNALELPESLREAIRELHRTRSREGRRRQVQFIGKLMRQVDPAPLQEAVAQFKLGGAQDALALHQAERWREEMLADDGAVTRWMADQPGTDAQQLRALIRHARLEVRPDTAAGASVRQGRHFRDLFQFIKAQLKAAPETP
ncbi:MAG: ribosome biogenesis factor YjgA [Betaproteobacteria bacterium]|jgi:ribosome-associated protein